MKLKRILSLICIFFIMFALPIKAFAEDEKVQHVILIDAGHGGIDGGAKSKNGTIEKDINLAIALKLKKKLEDNGYVQRIKRTDDKRAYSIMTTEKAESIKQEVYAIMDTWEEKLKSCFTTEEAKQFMKLLNKLESENLI